MTPERIPPHIPPQQSVRFGLTYLRNAMHCVPLTWPRAVYEDDIHVPPVPGLVHVMEPDAVATVLSGGDGAFGQANMFRRVLRPIWGKGLAVAQGEDWRWQRRAVAPAFTPAAAAHVVPHANAASARIIGGWHGETATRELFGPLGDTAAHVVIDALLDGIGDDEARRIIMHHGAALTHDLRQLNPADILRLPEWMRGLTGRTGRDAAGNLRAALMPLLQERLAHPRNDTSLPALLANARDTESGRRLDPERAGDLLTGSMAAGRETTALALAWTLWLLALFPDVQERLRAEISDAAGDAPLDAGHVETLGGVRAAIMESMRLYPPAPAHLRDCLRDTELCGVRIRRGTLVTIPVYAMHRHRKLWEAPDAFRPERFAGLAITDKALRGRYTPFGGGPRICLGMHFAMTEMIVVIANLLRAFRFEEDKEFVPGFAVAAGFYPADGIRVIVSPA
ncbi:MAG: cytochrome P450 [Notoacmeibacter sp.]|nr:cytochrome P450 [Notoacmeibacter sp.]